MSDEKECPYCKFKLVLRFIDIKQSGEPRTLRWWQCEVCNLYFDREQLLLLERIEALESYEKKLIERVEFWEDKTQELEQRVQQQNDAIQLILNRLWVNNIMPEIEMEFIKNQLEGSSDAKSVIGDGVRVPEKKSGLSENSIEADAKRDETLCKNMHSCYACSAWYQGCMKGYTEKKGNFPIPKEPAKSCENYDIQKLIDKARAQNKTREWLIKQLYNNDFWYRIVHDLIERFGELRAIIVGRR